MYLSREEERILAGHEGEAKALALKVIVKVGESLGAERLVGIKHAHVSGASYMTIGEAGRRFLEKLASMGAKFSVPTTVNPVSYDVEEPDRLPRTRLEPRVLKGQSAILKALESMGAELLLSCTPYYAEIPARAGLKEGDHVAWGESSAVAYANSVLGIRTNREGGPLALMAAIAGRTYYYGAHDPEWRKPVKAYRVAVPRPLDEAVAGILGEYVALTHDYERPPLIDAWFSGDAALKEFLAAIGTAGSLAMAYIPGVTPGDPGNDIIDVEELGEEEVRRLVEEKEPTWKPDIIYVGCPHAGVEEVTRLARTLKRAGRVRAEVVVSTSRSVYLKLAAAGVVAELEAAGARFIRDTCLIVSPFSRQNKGVKVATNSYKAYHYLKKRGLEVGIASIERLVELAK